MFDIICIGNATRDVFIDLGRGHGSNKDVCFSCGSKNEIKEIDIQTGGGATNTSFSYSKLGLNSSVLIAIGKDEIGSSIIARLKQEKVDTSLVVTEEKYKSAYSAIITGHKGDCVLFTYGGATSHMHESDIDWDKLNSKWAHITSFHSEKSVLEKIINHLHENNTNISFNPGKKELSLGLENLSPMLKKCKILFVNKEESFLLTKEEDIETAAKKLQEFTDIVVITLSSKGALCYDGTNVYYESPFKVNVIDVTGAGDAFNSAFTSAIIYSKDISTALKWGSAQAASVLTKLGAKNKLMNKEELEEFISSHSSFTNG